MKSEPSATCCEAGTTRSSTLSVGRTFRLQGSVALRRWPWVVLAVLWVWLTGCPPLVAPAPVGPGASGTSELTNALPSEFSVLAWNVNAGVSEPDPAVLGQAVLRLRSGEAADIYALSEVNPEWEAALAQAFAERGRYGSRLSESGRQQRLMLAWNETRFEALEVNELGRVNEDGYGRAPLAALLQERATGARFLFVVVHLRSANGDARRRESEILRDLLVELDYPTVVAGDFNYRCPSDGTAPVGCDPAFDAFVQGGHLRWIAPVDPEPSMCRSRYTTMLDLVFVSGPALEREHVEFGDSAWCDGMGDGAHRAVRAELRWAPAAAPPVR